MEKDREWLFEKYKREFVELNKAFIQPPSSDITKKSYLASFGNYYIKGYIDYSSKALYAIFWRALKDSDKAIEYFKNKEQRKELVEDKILTIKQLSKPITNKKHKPEQLKLF